VDLVLGNQEKTRLLTILREVRKNGAPEVRVGAIAGLRRIDGDEYGPGIDPDRTRAFLKVQDGCNYACSFCVVPAVRGPNRSLPANRILDEIGRLHAAGFPEVVLTGIHLGTYGRDLSPRTSLVELCRQLAALPTSPRIRLSSLDPNEVTPELVELLARSSRFCRHLHLPLQSGDEGILRRMRRGHTAAEFRSLVSRLVRAVPGIAVTADVIVGFPGEDDRAFLATRDLLDALPLAGLHIFSYSKRAGTEAAALAGQVSRAVKKERNRALRALAARKAEEYQRRFVGAILDVVVLHGEDAPGCREGLSDNYLRVRLRGEAGLQGSLVRVRVEGVTDGWLEGTVLKPSEIARTAEHPGESVDSVGSVR
jgi:threonylcarbamoyladenosine tRNA methylthiotransferase MtaB